MQKVAVFYAEGSASPLTIYAASLDICELIFLYRDTCSEEDINQLKLLGENIKTYNTIID